MNFLLFLVGFFLTLPAITLGWLAKPLPINMERPWVDGVVINTLRSWKRYTVTSWLRRLVAMWRNPQIVKQYLKILTNKERVFGGHFRYERVTDLIPQHDVQTDHEHHRARVEAYRRGAPVESVGGPIVVVDGIIHDGHHRVAAAREAGVEYVRVWAWISERPRMESAS